MAIVRRIEIENFRSIRRLSWCPEPGFNCLVGPGDAGKTTILDAIDFCLGARRNLNATDADFHGLDVCEPISIKVVLGKLDDALKNVDAYGDFLRGYDIDKDKLEEEPAVGLETVLWLHLTIAQDLEPLWTLQSSRAAAKGLERNLKWADRERIAPLRLGAGSDINLAWKRGSLLNKLSDETPDVSETLSAAARDARKTFGDTAQEQLEDALKIVDETASDLGVMIGGAARAMLDVHAVAFGSGTVSLHTEAGVPFRNMGTGSKRLLISGMQDRAAKSTDTVIVDEVEVGLEPHRLIRFLKSLGSKDDTRNRQVFATSHSPIVLQELTHEQLNIVRTMNSGAETKILKAPETAQGLLRASPSSFLAKSVIVCEGKTEVGFLRGIDLLRMENGGTSLDALGVSLMDCDGGSEKRPFEKAAVLHELGYRVAIFIDNDRPIPTSEAKEFETNGGSLFSWKEGQSIEDAIFSSAHLDTISKILDLAVELNDETLLQSKVASASHGKLKFKQAQAMSSDGTLTQEQKQMLGKAAGGKSGWFKDVDRMEQLARKVIGKNIKAFDDDFRVLVRSLIKWQLA